MSIHSILEEQQIQACNIAVRRYRVLCAMVSLLLVVNTAQAQPNTADEFGAESIVGNNSDLLPLNLVEETEDDSSDAVTFQSNQGSTGGQNEPPSLLESLESVSYRQIPQSEQTSGGLRIVQLGSQHPLSDLGFRGNDIVVSVGGTSITNKRQFVDAIMQSTELPTSVAVVERDGQEIVVPLVSGSDSEYSGATGDEATSEETTTILNVTDVDIAALVKTFSKLTKRNYIVDSAVKGTVTIHLPSPVTIPNALRILDTVLLLKGFTTVPVAENTWKVVSAKDARQTTIPLVASSSPEDSDVMVTKMIRLKHIAAQDLQQLLSQFVSKDGVINAFEGTNSLIVIDSAQNIGRLQELIAELDVPAIDQELSIIPILHANAEDLAEKINEILGEEEEEQTALSVAQRTSQARSNNIARSARTLANQTATSGNVKARSLGFKIIPDERTNSIIVVADAEMSIRVKALVEQLDSELDKSGGRFYVYRLQHADSEELSEILNSLINGTDGSSASDDNGTQGSSLSSRRSTTTTGQNAQNTTNARLSSALRRSRDLLRQRLGTQGAESEGRVNLEGEVSIAPDPATNSLVINASRSDYSKIKDVIEMLDVKRRQVIVEATILEITLSNSEGMGVELQGTAAFQDGGGIAQTNYGGLTNLLTNPAALTDLTIAAASSGTVTLPGGITIPSQAVLISAVSRLSNVNVLSAPTIMATDNQEAEIIVGQNVPFVTSTSTDTANINNTFNTIERQDVGITLRITPQISSGDFVVLNIFVEISNVVAGTANDANGPTTTIRTTETAVTVRDGQMVVTGGLIQDSVTDSTRGVPFLQDIPVLGHLFKRQDSVIDKTNLLILITPRVIADQFDARLATKSGLQPLEKHIQTYDLYPDRKEIIASDSIDTVVESYANNPEFLPTPITPPAKRVSPQRNGKIEITTSSAESSDDVVELTVSPQLPGIGATSATERENAKRSSLAMPIDDLESIDADTSEGEQLHTEPTIAILRPLINGAPKLKVIAVPNTSDDTVSNYFQVGSVYADTESPEATSYVCIGRYSSIEEASELHTGITKGAVESLSPSELVGLGKSAWIPSSMGAQ